MIAGGGAQALSRLGVGGVLSVVGRRLGVRVFQLVDTELEATDFVLQSFQLSFKLSDTPTFRACITCPKQ